MNIFTDVLFLFVYLLAMFFFELPNVKNKNYPVHKFFIFLSVFAYYYVIQIIKKIRNNCKVDFYIVLQEALMMGLYCVLGYSLYVDFVYWDCTKGMFGDIKEVNIAKRYLIIATIIVTFVACMKLLELLFHQNPNDCIMNS